MIIFKCKQTAISTTSFPLADALHSTGADKFAFDMGTEAGIPIRGEFLNPFHFPKQPLLVDYLNKEVSAWIVDQGLMDGDVLGKITKARFSDLVASPCSELSREKAVVNAIFVAFLFFYDDVIDHASQTLDGVVLLNKRLMAALDQPDLTHEEPLVRAFSSFVIKAQDAGIVLNAFRQDVGDYFFMAKTEFCQRSEVPSFLGPTSAVYRYMDARVFSGAVYVVLALAADSANLCVQDMRSGFRRFFLMTQCVSNAICIANDIYSYRKECREMAPENIISVMGRSSDASLQELLVSAIKYHDSYVRTYLQDKEFLQKNYPADKDFWDKTCMLYEKWMDSNHDFSSTSIRYVLPST